MKILGIQVLKGPNIWSIRRKKLIQMRLDLEEFSHVFTTADASVGLIRLRATLLEVTPAGEKLIGQRSVVVQQPATTPDAPGGVRALAAATDTAIEEIDQWLQQSQAR